MQARIDHLNKQYHLVSQQLENTKQALVNAELNLAKTKKTMSRMWIKRKCLALASWNSSRVAADPIWNLAFPLTLISIFVVLVFAPLWLVTGSFAIAAVVYLFASTVFLFGFWALNGSHFSNPRQKLPLLDVELEAARDLKISCEANCKACKNELETFQLQKSVIEKELVELTASAAHQNQLRINSIMSQEWRLLRGIPWEEFLRQLLECQGYSVEMTKASGDQGVDLIARVSGVSIAIQAKGYANNVGNAAVQQAYTGMAIYGCTHCAVITNSEFTQSAIAAARKTGCILVGCSEIPSFANGELSSFYSPGMEK